jgi:hypothetical protein
MAVRNVQATNLAWALIEAAKPHMNAGERNYVVVTVGAGDMFAAIRSLINLIAAKRIPLRSHLVQLCSTWLDAHTFHDEHDHLHRVIEGFVMPTTIQGATASRRLSAPPKPRPPLALTGKLHTRRRPTVRSADRRAVRS